MPHECARDGTCSFGFTSCYHHLKVAARAGVDLTDDEATFVGLYPPHPRERGWVSAELVGPSFEIASVLEGPDGDLYRALVTPTYMEFLA